MALSVITPESVTGDLVTLKEAVLLLKDTGYPASQSTLRRWINRHGVLTKRIGRVDYVCFSDVLLVQRDEYERMLAEAHQR
ncbi:hypothetical protein [Streptomyces sp. NPDC048516]|uniref:hypothetical protein n=1 Tax=Streptomyces sp. NPDC048516 TaxID=3365565 RepID=UPI00371E5673